MRSSRSDPNWLRAQVQAGTTIAAMAALAGCSGATVRRDLRHHEIPTPKEQRLGHVDWAKIETDWRAGIPIGEIVRVHRVGEGTVRYRMRKRKALRPRRSRPYPELDDPSWLRVELALWATAAAIAARLGCSRNTVRDAVRRHKLPWAEHNVSPVERVKALRNPAERALAAKRLVAELKAELAAARELESAAAADAR